MFGPSSSRPPVVFDLDGVIANTRPLVIAAYEDAGITPPADSWGKPWTHWLPQQCDGDLVRAAELHHLKNQNYARRLATCGAPPLPPYAVLVELSAREHRAGIITAASLVAALQVCKSLAIPRRLLLAAGCSAAAKVDALTRRATDTGIYVDDDEQTGAWIAEQAGWTFVHYKFGTPYEEFWEALWTRSS